MNVEHLRLMFGALAALPTSGVRGYGIPGPSLSFALLVLPAVWDWYLLWRERRRGFFTVWEVDMLNVGLALTRAETGWLRQHPHLALRLAVVDGLVSADDVAAVQADWAAACERFQAYARLRVKEIKQVARVHRDSFEPILPVLEADRPLAEYRRIADEVLRLMPREDGDRLAAAEAVRTFLMLRFGLHLGLRQKNLRQLLVTPRGATPRTALQLTGLRRGEVRWSERYRGWEVFVPVSAFKNARSAFFGGRPFTLVLADLSGLYDMIDAYLDRHRTLLLGKAADTGAFFIKTVKRSDSNPEYERNTFYDAWKLAIQQYGIQNPYTGKGAIPGLLPHGPHNVRDVLATHILKRTGSFEQASYAIQDTPEVVARHYGRFLPHDKLAIAAEVLNREWQ